MAPDSNSGDPIRRASFVCIGAVVTATLVGGLVHPLLGVGLGAVGTWIVTQLTVTRIEPLRQTLMSLPVKWPRSGAPTFAEMTSLVERARERVGDVLGQLRHERNDLVSILQGASNGIIVLGYDERLERINEAAHRILNSPPDALGRRLTEVARNLELLDFAEAVRRGEAPAPRSIEFSTQAGKRLLRVFGAQLSGDDERTRVLITLHDQTGIRHLEQVRTDFVTNVTHEMRSPLASILGFAESLAGEPDVPEDMLDGLERIARNARRLDAIVSDLIELSRLEHAETADLQLVNPGLLIKRIATEFADAASERGIRLELELEALPNDAPLDADLIDQALTNLLDNAIKYSPEGSTVRVQGTLLDGRLELRVIDAGPGIPREHQARIFERFYRVDAARSRAVGGTGLGLSIVKHAAALHGGSVRVESELGRGATFILSLPWTSK